MSKKDIIFIGASGVAHEMIDTIFDCNESGEVWNLLGILDDDLSKSGKEFYRGVKILGTSEMISKQDLSKTHFLVTFSSPVNYLNREGYIGKLQEKHPGIKFATLIHPGAYVSKTAKVGQGVFLSTGAVVDSNAVIGDHAIVLFHSVVSRFVTVGKFTFISAGVNIVGNRNVGSSVYVGAKCTINADIGNGTLMDSSVFVKKDVPEFSIVTAKSEFDILTYKSADKMRAMLGRLS